MTRQIRRVVLALTVLALAGATHEARADELGRKLCTLGCGAGTIDCHLNGGSEKLCTGFAAGCVVGCNMAV